MTAYYNEIDPYAAQWLRNLIAAGHIAPGDVDERDIREIKAHELKGYAQCHFFAGIGGWSLALRLAGWSDDRPVWTGSCSCQPFSTAGRGKAQEDERHLWPAWFQLIATIRPSIVFGEQVAAAIAHGWLDDIFDDLEREDYETAAAVLPACSVGAPHKRDRLWFIANSTKQRHIGGEIGNEISAQCEIGRVRENEGLRLAEFSDDRCGRTMADTKGAECDRERPFTNWESNRPANGGEDVAHTIGSGQSRSREYGVWGGQAKDRKGQADNAIPECFSDFWSIEPDVGRVANGVPARVGKLRALGNAIVPQVAAEFIRAATY